MTRFREIAIHEDSGTVEIGAGLTWTDVFEYLIPKGLNVAGGRWNGVGVGGLTLGGGECYSLWAIHRRLKGIYAWQDILGKQTSMGSPLTPLRNSSSCCQAEK